MTSIQQTTNQSEDSVIPKPKWRLYINRLIAGEISVFSRYYDQVIQLNKRDEDTGHLLDYLDNPKKSQVDNLQDLSDLSSEKDKRSIILLNGNLNYDYDIQRTLDCCYEKMSSTTRLVAVLYNPYLSWLFSIAHTLGIIKGIAPETFITRKDLSNICKLSHFEVVRFRSSVFFPFKLFGLGNIINKSLVALPFFRLFSLTSMVVLRPIKKVVKAPSISIVIPARNESGNIENALKRLDKFAEDMEIIFIEGNSTDDTWDEIQRVAKAYEGQWKIKIGQQTGKGKSNACEKGFELATGELLTILDADLTMPPEQLGRYYRAYTKGQAEFINGSRLLYPMEGEAMRFLNKLGNIFFAKALSWVLDHDYTDSLCGTKLFTRWDYDRFLRWRDDFGKHDPFGDFDLLFPAASLSIGTIDIPIRYLDRTYGDTNISRFRHGVMLLKMTLVGFLKIKTRLI